MERCHLGDFGLMTHNPAASGALVTVAEGAAQLSILSSSSTVVTNTCQWASLAMARASSQEPHFTSLNQS